MLKKLKEYLSVDKLVAEGLESNSRLAERVEEAASMLDHLSSDERELLNAVNKGDFANARRLLSMGVDPNMSLPGTTLLHLAVGNEIDWETEYPTPPSSTFVGELLAAGADAFVENASGSPLDVAKGTGRQTGIYSHPLAHQILLKHMEEEIAREEAGQ
jgi:hypothetical protein